MFSQPDEADHISVSINALKTEIKQLQYLSGGIMNEITELREDQLAIKESKTIKGKFFNLMGYFFSLYCVYRIFMCVINLIFKRNPENDPITMLFEIGTKYFNIQIDTKFWSQQLSFFFVAILVFNSVRNFLSNASNV